jgi:hypothetical protein
MVLFDVRAVEPPEAFGEPPNELIANAVQVGRGVGSAFSKEKPEQHHRAGGGTAQVFDPQPAAETCGNLQLVG